MRFWVTCGLMAGLLVGSPAFAQKPHEDPSMAEAKQRFNEGIRFADDGNHEAARLKFSQAWMLLKSPAILFNLARSEQLAGHPVEALEHFRLFAKMGADPKVTEQQKERAKEFIAELSSKVGQIQVDAAPNSQITIDGKPTEWSTQGDPIPVLPGAHEVTATLEDRTAKTTVEATAGTVVKASLRDMPKPAPPAASQRAIAPPPEEHASSWSAGRIAGVAVAGGGVVALGLGFYFHLDSTSAGSDADDLVKKVGKSGCNVSLPTRPVNDCNAIADARDQQDRSAVIRNALWIGGGAMVIGGAALYLLSKPASEKPRAWHVLPRVSPKSSGLSVVGTF